MKTCNYFSSFKGYAKRNVITSGGRSALDNCPKNTQLPVDHRRAWKRKSTVCFQLVASTGMWATESSSSSSFQRKPHATFAVCWSPVNTQWRWVRIRGKGIWRRPHTYIYIYIYICIYIYIYICACVCVCVCVFFYIYIYIIIYRYLYIDTQ